VCGKLLLMQYVCIGVDNGDDEMLMMMMMMMMMLYVSTYVVWIAACDEW